MRVLGTRLIQSTVGSDPVCACLVYLFHVVNPFSYIHFGRIVNIFPFGLEGSFSTEKGLEPLWFGTHVLLSTKSPVLLETGFYQAMCVHAVTVLVPVG